MDENVNTDGGQTTLLSIFATAAVLGAGWYWGTRSARIVLDTIENTAAKLTEKYLDAREEKE